MLRVNYRYSEYVCTTILFTHILDNCVRVLIYDLITATVLIHSFDVSCQHNDSTIIYPCGNRCHRIHSLEERQKKHSSYGKKFSSGS